MSEKKAKVDPDKFLMIQRLSDGKTKDSSDLERTQFTGDYHKSPAQLKEIKNSVINAYKKRKQFKKKKTKSVQVVPEVSDLNKAKKIA